MLLLVPMVTFYPFHVFWKHGGAVFLCYQLYLFDQRQWNQLFTCTVRWDMLSPKSSELGLVQQIALGS